MSEIYFSGAPPLAISNKGICTDFNSLLWLSFLTIGNVCSNSRHLQAKVFLRKAPPPDVGLDSIYQRRSPIALLIPYLSRELSVTMYATKPNYIV